MNSKRVTSAFECRDPDLFKRRLLNWMKSFPKAILLDGNRNRIQSTMHWEPYDWVAGIGAVIACSSENSFLKEFQAALNQSPDWWFGFIGYDVKNEIEDICSENPNTFNFPGSYFFIPELVVICKGHHITLQIHEKSPGSSNINGCYESILQTPPYKCVVPDAMQFRQQLSKQQYIEQIGSIREHIRQGDIYELNYCMEFFTENAQVDPLSLLLILDEKTPAPFSCYLKLNNRYIISASPERFLRREGNRLISQPMKGTAPRAETEQLDQQAKAALASDSKEKSENVMIVDLVRNDLSALAERGTVQVDELFKIYSFPKVHQMVSTVSCTLKRNITFTEIIRKTFPMGSMTGAPKIKAMELIETYEQMRRGAFSGTAGYIHPSGDFDFNVLIRSLLYDAGSKDLSVMSGSAITWQSDAGREYQECLLKAGYMIEAIGGQLEK